MCGINHQRIIDILTEQYGENVSITYAFSYEKKMFNRRKITLWLITENPGMLISKGGRNHLKNVEERVKNFYSMINEVRLMTVRSILTKKGIKE